MDISRICVCGAGTMGCGIAQVSAAAGFSTILFDVRSDVLDRAKSTLEENLRALAERGKITVQDSDLVSRRIHFVNDVKDSTGDLVIEAIIEDEATKIALFTQLQQINGADTIFATNTSSLSVSKLGEQSGRPARFIGMHFFNPPTIMKLVEVVKGKQTMDEVVQATVSVAERMGKIPVVCRDSPGFIVNRVARPYYLESLRILEEGETKIGVIDTLLEATGFRMGPFKLMDLIGNDVNYQVSNSLYQQLNRPDRLMPSFIQKDKVAKRELGKKTGKGYYSYDDKHN